MSESQQEKRPSSPALAPVFDALREDLLLLALLHDRELDRETLMGLRQDCAGAFLGLELEGARARSALQLFRQGVDDVPEELDQDTLDILAAEYADIYLNYTLQTSPYESVWTDEDGLTMQEAMFEIRDWYRSHGLAVENWRMRADDHLVTQLQFLGYLLDGEPTPARLEEVSRFLDEHLLRWVGAFAERVSDRCKTRLYAGLADLTAAYLDEARDLAAQLLDSPRPSAEEIEERTRRKRAAGIEVPAPAPFAPGSAPSW
jgi:TorA maturation chaperone TorD